MPGKSTTTSRRAARIGTIALVGALVITPVAGSLASAQQKRAPAPVTAASLQKGLAALEKPPSSGVALTEEGSSLFFPLWSEWASHYPHTSVSIAAAAGDSVAGISEASSGVVNIGASDVYVAPSQVQSGVMDIPEVVSAQTVNYNVPGLVKGTHLKLNPKVLNEMYAGLIKMWNAPAIMALNKGVKIPAVRVVPIHRSDDSGDTFSFTSYLAFGDPESFLASTGPNLTVTWPPVPGSVAETGGPAVLQTCEATPGCLTYIAISYLNSEASKGVGFAALENGRGNYVTPTNAGIADEIASFKAIPPTGGVNTVYSKSAPTGYPIANFEYAIVLRDQPDVITAQAVKALLAWGIDQSGGSAPNLLAPVHFCPLPANAEQVAIKLISSIG